MSVKVTSMVWKSKMPSTAKIVAVRLADFADDEGGRIFPSNARVAADCGLSERAVRDAIRTLESMDLLVLVAAEQPGRHLPREYRLDLAALEKSAAESGGHDVPPGTTCRPARGSKAGGTTCPQTVRGSIKKGSVERASAVEPIVKTVSPAVAVIAAFDAERVGAFGEAQARLCPAATDRVTAERWLTAGADLDLCRDVIRAGMKRRAATGRSPPETLTFFDRPIADALAERQRPMPTEERTHGEQRRTHQQQRRGGGFAALALAEFARRPDAG